MRLLMVLVGIAVVLTGCTRPHRPIPDGLYVAGEETLIVSAQRIAFNVHIQKPQRKGTGFEVTLGTDLHSRNRQYEVLQDGTINLCCGTSNDYFLFGFDWYWDGKNIVKIGLDEQVLATFRKRPSR